MLRIPQNGGEFDGDFHPNGIESVKTHLKQRENKRLLFNCINGGKYTSPMDAKVSSMITIGSG